KKRVGVPRPPVVRSPGRPSRNSPPYFMPAKYVLYLRPLAQIIHWLGNGLASGRVSLVQLTSVLDSPGGHPRVYRLPGNRPSLAAGCPSWATPRAPPCPATRGCSRSAGSTTASA